MRKKGKEEESKANTSNLDVLSLSSVVLGKAFEALTSAGGNPRESQFWFGFPGE